MCPHCEARVKEALEALEGVNTALPNHIEGIVTLTLSAPVDDALLRSVIEERGYKMVD